MDAGSFELLAIAGTAPSKNNTRAAPNRFVMFMDIAQLSTIRK
jgi:hypothetical protein